MHAFSAAVSQLHEFPEASAPMVLFFSKNPLHYTFQFHCSVHAKTGCMELLQDVTKGLKQIHEIGLVFKNLKEVNIVLYKAESARVHTVFIDVLEGSYF